MQTADDILRKAFHEKGITFAPDGNLVRLRSFAGQSPIPDDLLRYMNARRGKSDTEAHQKCVWVERLSDVVDRLVAEGAPFDWAVDSVFWTKLHGVLTELRADYTKYLEPLRSTGVDLMTYVPNRGSLLEYGLTAYRCLEGVRKQLTEEELIYADYRRQTEGHTIQSCYSVRWSRKAGIIDKRRIQALGREYTIAELDAALDRVGLAFDGDEHAIAVHVARKIRPTVRALVPVMRVGVNRPAAG
jgi:hypothetical protein